MCADCSDDQRLQSAVENRMLAAMAEALQNVAAMFLIMAASYVFMKKSPYPVEVVNNLVFNFFLPVTVFHSITGLQKIPAVEFLLMAASGLPRCLSWPSFPQASPGWAVSGMGSGRPSF